MSIFFNRAKELQLLQAQVDLKTAGEEISRLKAEKIQHEALQKENVELRAELKISRAETAAAKLQGKIEVAQAAAQAKSEYADHAMAINDERLKEIRDTRNNYEKNVVEIIKAGVQPMPVLMGASTVIK